MGDSSSSERNFRKAKRDFRSAVDQWATAVSKGEVSADELRAIKEVEQYFETFAAAPRAVKDSKTDPDKVEDLKECFKTFEQVFNSVVREYDSLNSNFKLREIKELFGVQNSVMCERLDGVCEKISSIEKRVKDVESNSKPKHSEHDLLSSLPGPSKVVPQFSRFSIPDVDVDQIGQPFFCSGLNPLSKDFVPPSGPAETVSSGNLRGYNTSVDVAGFILRHGLLGDRNFKFSGNPVDYVEFTRHYQSCYASKISNHVMPVKSPILIS